MMICVPTAKPVVGGSVAVPPLTAAMPSVTDPSVKVTEPSVTGAPEAVTTTVAAIVTEVPEATGLAGEKAESDGGGGWPGAGA